MRPRRLFRALRPGVVFASLASYLRVFFIPAKRALRPRTLFRALRPGMIFASLASADDSRRITSWRSQPCVHRCSSVQCVLRSSPAFVHVPRRSCAHLSAFKQEPGRAASERKTWAQRAGTALSLLIKWSPYFSDLSLFFRPYPQRDDSLSRRQFIEVDGAL